MVSKIKQYWVNNRKQCIDLCIAAAMIVVAILINVLYHPCIVVGTSMMPTYENSDTLKTKVRFTESDIHRGTVVVFEKEDMQMVKRVVGLPGERLFLCDGQVWVFADGMKYPIGFNFDPILPDHAGLLANTVYTVPKGCYFCIGDNRNNSHDCRAYGAIPFNELERVVDENQEVF